VALATVRGRPDRQLAHERLPEVEMKLLFAAFLAAHALIHASYVTPAPPRTAGGPEWPFEFTRSWLVTALQIDPSVARVLGISLAGGSVILLVAAALATAGWIVPSETWPALVVAGTVCSLMTLGLFFHPWLLLGIAIDLGLLWAVVSGWRPFALGT
jgi:hypothetical protein